MVAVLASVALLGLSAATASGQVQGSGVTLRASAGFDRQVRAGAWAPVVVDLENQGDDVSGQVAVEDANPTGGSRRSQYVADVSLPRGSRKQVALTVPNQVPRRLAVTFSTASGQVLASTELEVNVLASGDVLVGTLASRPAGLAAAAQMALPGSGRSVRLVNLEPASLPQLPAVLDNFDALLITDTPTAELRPEQITALEDWVAAGGALVLGGGPEARRALGGLTPALLPVALDGRAARVPAAALAPALPGLTPPDGLLIAAGGQVHAAQARTLAETDGLPLMVVSPLGAGQVVYLGFDPGADPISGWSGAPAFWQEVFAHGLSPAALTPPATSRAGSSTFVQPGGGNAIAGVPSLEPPDWRRATAFLAIYILAVGPLSYLVLRRVRRRELAWLSVPLLALVFAAGPYLAALKQKGFDLTVNSVAVLRLEPSLDHQRAQSVVVVVPPGEADYHLEVQPAALVAPVQALTRAGGLTAFGPSADLRVRSSPNASVDLLGTTMWASTGVWIEGQAQIPGRVEADLRLEGSHLVGQVTNLTEMPLEGAALVVGPASVLQLQEMPPGTSAAVDLALAAPPQPTLNPLPTPVTASIASRLYPSSVNGATDAQAVRRQQAVELVLGSEAQPAPPPGSVYFFGFTDRRLARVDLAGEAPGGTTTTLVASRLPVRLSGTYSVPPGLLASAPVATSGASFVGNTSSSFSLGQGWATYDFALPDRTASATLNALHVWAFSGPTASLASQPLSMQLLDWQHGTWQDLSVAAQPSPAAVPSPQPSTGALNVVPGRGQPPQVWVASAAGDNLTRFVSTDGLVRVRLVRSDAGSQIFLSPWLALDGAERGA